MRMATCETRYLNLETGLSHTRTESRVRKAYSVSKCRESWSEDEHDKFVESLHLFDRDWKKIQAFVGSKTVIQIRSHAQKYFLKVEKTGSNERVPPPRPKRKAAHPYPQKASKTARVINQPIGHFPSSSVAVCDPDVNVREASSVLTDLSGSASTPTWSFGSVPMFDSSNVGRDDATLVKHPASNCCRSSNESASVWPVAQPKDQRDRDTHMKVMPDFTQVYSFIGSVFDPGSSDHMQRLKSMDPINVETVLLLMRNLSANLQSPAFEQYRKLLSSYDLESGKARSCNSLLVAPDNSKAVIPAVY